MPLAVPLLLALPALAQEPLDAAPPPPPPAVLPMGERFVWSLRGRLGNVAPVTGIAIQEGGEGAWLAVDAFGDVYRSEDAGATWFPVRTGFRGVGGLGERPEAAEVDDEDVLLEAEAALEEAARDNADVDEELEFPTAVSAEDTRAAVEAATAEAATAARGEIAERAEEVAEDAAARTEDALEDLRAGFGDTPPTAWFSPADPEVALVGWPDAIWRSIDGGISWKQVEEVGALTFFAGKDPNLVVAGTREGVLYSLDGGGTWIDVVDATDGAAIRQVAQEGGWLYAASDRGLFRSRDGLHWAGVGALGSTPVVSVVPDPAWDGGLWVATDATLLRSDDDGATFYVAARHPLPSLRRVVHLDHPGHLLAITGDGVWESMDGGVRWLPAIRLLREPDVYDVAFVDGRPVIAAASGVWEMVRPTPLGEERGRRVASMPLAEAVAIAQRRTGLDLDLLGLARRRVAAALAPALDLSFDYDQVDGRSAEHVDLANQEWHDSGWKVGLSACWGACAATVEVADFLSAGDDALFQDDSIYVVDGDVYDEGDVVAAAANVAAQVRSYRQHLASTVADAWIARQRLAAEAPLVRNLPLRDQVKHALDLAEIDARLDLYTEGAFSRSLTASEETR